jgi:hypothetical protein
MCRVQIATVLPVASVPSRGSSPNSPRVWTEPSLPLVVMRHCSRLTPLFVRPRQSTVSRAPPGCSATSGSGFSDDEPTATGVAHEPLLQTLR